MVLRCAAAIGFILILLQPNANADGAGIDLCASMETLSGQALFADNCAFCHGADGKGNGFLAQKLKLAPPDLTQLSKRTNGTFPLEHVTALLENGAGKTEDGDKAMPAWGKLFAHECGSRFEQRAILQLRRYLETIQAR